MRLEDKGLRGLKPRRGFCLELARKGKARVVAEGTLFIANSVLGVYFA